MELAAVTARPIIGVLFVVPQSTDEKDEQHQRINGLAMDCHALRVCTRSRLRRHDHVLLKQGPQQRQDVDLCCLGQPHERDEPVQRVERPCRDEGL